MTARIKHVGLYMRTAYFVASLRASTRLSAAKLEQRIRNNQYVAHGLPPPALDTVRDYFLLRRSPAVDPQSGDLPPWLFAAELEFPGASYAFFHPIFDFLVGQLESSRPWVARLQRIPDSWIDVAEARGDLRQVEEWREFNAALVPRRGRPRNQEGLDPLSFIHLTMMRLPEPYFSLLFQKEGLATAHARRYLSIEDEISLLLANSGMESLAALVGLLLEAAQIGNVGRLSAAKQGIREHLDRHGIVPTARRFEDRLRYLIESDLCLGRSARRYSAICTYGFGLPATWRAQMVPPFIARDIAQFRTTDSDLAE